MSDLLASFSGLHARTPCVRCWKRQSCSSACRLSIQDFLARHKLFLLDREEAERRAAGSTGHGLRVKRRRPADEGGDEMVAVVVVLLHSQRERDAAGR